ncbi:MAG: 23S rRNA (uracil(1939)-C(5))-methyltransferase RlmD [Acetobacteraceae bacterium]|nr:23S rRNA (uracil(1939)-C(5))-methyltransferase RlmD [Acetobacteraceae bacterium]
MTAQGEGEAAPAVPPVRVGQEIRVPVTGLSSAGDGVARCHGLAVFVPFAIPGELVAARVTAVARSYARARLVEVLEASPHRVAPPCPVYHRCGGCQLQHVEYAAQLELKRRTLEDALARIGRVSCPVPPTLEAPSPWHYRSKLQSPVRTHPTRPGRLAGGCFAPFSHRLVPADSCLIQHPQNNRLLRAALEAAAEAGVPPYREEDGSGVLRHVVGRVAAATGRVLAGLVTNGPMLPGAGRVVARLRKRVPGLVGVVQNLNPRRTNVILGPSQRVLWGEGWIDDRLGGLSFRVSLASFFQVNPAQAERLFACALKLAGLQGGETVLDVYCGTGALGLLAAGAARRVVGVESEPSAVEDARRNAAINGVANLELLAGEAERVLPALARSGFSAQVAFLDPPRQGCRPEALAALAHIAPRRVVYISCSPATFARDIGLMGAAGYRPVLARPVDMFPQTCHVECVALLERA